MSNIVQIDGDYLLHAYAFVAQHTWYTVVANETNKFIARCESWEEVKNNGYNKANQVHIDKDVEIKDFSVARKALDGVMGAILKECGTGRCNLFLTGEGNFREEVGTMRPYKWNRKEEMCGIYGRQYNPKPHYYQQLKRYMIEEWEATTVHGMEADDVMVISHLEDIEHSIIATVDKDLKQVHGRHFDIGDKWKKFTISKKDAKFFLYTQILTGDSVDGIPGIFRVGEGTANKILKGATCEKELFYRCAEEWIKYAKKLGGTEEDGKDMMMETIKLVYMLRDKDIEAEHEQWEQKMRKYERTKRNEV